MVSIREVAPRDGLQIEAPVPTDRKVQLLERIVATGVRRVEVTAFVSAKAVPALADAEELAAALDRWPEVEFSALCANVRGAHRAVAAGVTRLEYVVSASDSHSLANARRTTGAAVAEIPAVAEAVHGAGGELEVIIATAWDCPFEGPIADGRVVDLARQAADVGADALSLGDTIGTVVPGRAEALVHQVRTAVPGLPLGGHFHDTRGTGLASAWAAYSAGVDTLDASVGGLGGCPFAPGASGNIATEELVYMLEDSGVETGINLDLTLQAAAFAGALVGGHEPSRLLKANGRLVPRGTRAKEEP